MTSHNDSVIVPSKRLQDPGNYENARVHAEAISKRSLKNLYVEVILNLSEVRNDIVSKGFSGVALSIALDLGTGEYLSQELVSFIILPSDVRQVPERPWLRNRFDIADLSQALSGDVLTQMGIFSLFHSCNGHWSIRGVDLAGENKSTGFGFRFSFAPELQSLEGMRVEDLFGAKMKILGIDSNLRPGKTIEEIRFLTSASSVVPFLVLSETVNEYNPAYNSNVWIPQGAIISDYARRGYNTGFVFASHNVQQCVEDAFSSEKSLMTRWY